MENTEKLHSDFLKEFLSKPNTNKTELPQKPVEKVVNNINTTLSDKDIIIENKFLDEHLKTYFLNNKSKYEEIYTSDLPCSDFYDLNDKIYLRPCTTKEIQDYSTFDNNNPFGFKNQLHDILSNCIVYEKADGTLLSINHLYDKDKLFLLYSIREKTFIDTNVLIKQVSYKDENNETQTINIELLRVNLEIYRNEPIMQFYDNKTNTIKLETS